MIDMVVILLGWGLAAFLAVLVVMTVGGILALMARAVFLPIILLSDFFQVVFGRRPTLQPDHPYRWAAACGCGWSAEHTTPLDAKLAGERHVATRAKWGKHVLLAVKLSKP